MQSTLANANVGKSKVLNVSVSKAARAPLPVAWGRGAAPLARAAASLPQIVATAAASAAAPSSAPAAAPSTAPLFKEGRVVAAQPPEGPPPAGTLRAVVIGSGVAGLVAARVLADRCDEVVLLERDGLASASAPDDANSSGSLSDVAAAVSARRRGVPQWQQPHVMLTRGLQELDALFPSLRDDLVAGGAVDVPTPRDWSIYDARLGGQLPHKYTAFSMLCATRSLIEAEIRVRLADGYGNVTTYAGCVVDGLETAGGNGSTGSGGRVTGVRLRGGRVVGADLVVDASGRGSRTPEWLAAAGFAAPAEATVDSRLVYTSAVYKLAPEYGGPAAAMVVAAPPDSRGALLMPIEGGLHHLILSGRGGERCAATDDAVAAFCASLPSSGVSDALAGAERVSELRVYERTANFRRRYEDLAAAADGAGGLPAGIAVIGDACAAFNPVYGQGMSVAVLEAVDLGERLAEALPARCVGGSGDGADYAQQEREQRAAEARRALPAATAGFMRNIGAIVAVPWALATGNDAPYCPGFKRAPAEAAVNAVFEAVSRYSQRDVDVHNVVMRVMHMLDPPTAMVAPRVLWRFAVDAALRALRLRGSSQQAS